jgi:hypothetical protein
MLALRPCPRCQWRNHRVLAVTAALADDGTAAPEVLGQMNAEHCARLERLWGDQKYRNNSLDDWLETTKATYSGVDSRKVAAV